MSRKTTSKGKRPTAFRRPNRPTPEESSFPIVDAALDMAEAFLTRKVCMFIREIGKAARRSDADLIAAGVDLSEELRLADPEEWRRETGRELPRNVEQLRTLMEECGYSPDFISGGDWTPREVGPVLIRRLRDAGWSEPLTRNEIADREDTTTRNLLRWEADGKIAIKRSGGKFRYRRTE
jgi:hypothetical protein